MSPLATDPGGAFGLPFFRPSTAALLAVLWAMGLTGAAAQALPLPSQVPALPPPGDLAPETSQPLPVPPGASPAAAPTPALPTPAGPDTLPATPLSPPSFAALDRDRDGLLDLEEASADPILRDGFVRLDLNGDGRLSREEYAAYQPGPADSGDG